MNHPLRKLACRLNRKALARTATALAIAATSVIAVASPTRAAVSWAETIYDSLYDYGSSTYTDISSITLGAFDNDNDNILALIYPRNAMSDNFASSSDYGAISLDVNDDFVGDFFISAPRATLPYSYSLPRLIVTSPAGAATGCSSQWSMTSDGTGYAVIIPWRCLGAPSSFRVEVWLSDLYGSDFLDFGRLLTPIVGSIAPVTPPPDTTPVVTAPPVTAPPDTAPPVTAPPVTVPVATLPPVTAPPVVIESRPGFENDWILFLVVRQPVSFKDLIQTTNCCYGYTGSKTAKVDYKSRKVCKMAGRTLFPLTVGTCSITLTLGKGKSKQVETLKLKVRRKA